MNVFVVTAYRFGDHEKHSYVVGVYNTYEMARYVGEIEETWRAGKYECEVQEFEITNRPDPRKLKVHMDSIYDG